MIADDLEQLEHFEQRSTKCVGHRQLSIAPRQHDTSQYDLLHVDKRRLALRPRQRWVWQRWKVAVLIWVRGVFVIADYRRQVMVIAQISRLIRWTFGIFMCSRELCCDVIGVRKHDLRGNLARQRREVEQWITTKRAERRDARKTRKCWLCMNEKKLMIINCVIDGCVHYSRINKRKSSTSRHILSS